MKWLLVLALLCGCTPLSKRRADYVAAHPGLAEYKRDMMLESPARATVGFTVEEVRLVMGRIHRLASDSDGIEIWARGARLLLYFENGYLIYWVQN